MNYRYNRPTSIYLSGSILFAILLLNELFSSPVGAQELPKGEGSEAASPASADYIVGPSDLIDLRVFRQPELSGRYRVSEAGTINMPFIGQVKAVGLTEVELAEALRERLLKILRKPEVSLTVVEHQSQMITIIGAVRSPGRYALKRSERLLDVIGMVGGLTESAGRTINLVRYTPKRSTEPVSTNDGVGDEEISMVSINLKDLIDGNLELNRQILPGDVINIPEADNFYVTGNVDKPGVFNLKAPTTLSQAIALAGGTSPEARKNHISLFRTLPGKAERVELSFSIGDIEKRKVKDPIIEPNDVIYVKGSESRSLGLSFLRALAGGMGGGLGLAVIR